MEGTPKYVVWPIEIDHITVRETEYTRSRDNQTIKGKAFLFYVHIPMFENDRTTNVIAAFEGQNDVLINRYKNLKMELVNGETVITAKTIRETLEPGKTEAVEYISPFDGEKYTTYGEWLATMGTKSAFAPKPGSKGMIFGRNIPISDGIQKWRRMNQDGTPAISQKTRQPIIETHTNVCALVLNVPGVGWTSPDCITPGELSEALRAEVTRMMTTQQRWKLIGETLPTLRLEDEAQTTPTASTTATEAQTTPAEAAQS